MLLQNYTFKNGLRILGNMTVIILLFSIAALREGTTSKTNIIPDLKINASNIRQLTIKHLAKNGLKEATIDFSSKGIWQITKVNGKKMGAIISTVTFSHATGYAGPIPMLLHLDNNNKIHSITILPNRETPSFINRISNSGFLKNWEGLLIKDALRKEVDVISGATMSSTAIITSIRQTLSILQNKNIALLPKPHQNNFFLFLTLGLVLLFAFYINSSFTKYCHRLRPILLLLDIIVIGCWSGQFLSLSTFMSWIKSGSPSLIGILLFMITVILPLLFRKKNFYCNWICPYGAAQELIGKIIPKKIKISPRIIHHLAKIRKYILFTLLLLLSLGSSAVILNYEPFAVFLIPFASLPVIIIASGFLLISLFINRPYCRFFCPTGALLSHISGKSKSKQQ